MLRETAVSIPILQHSLHCVTDSLSRSVLLYTSSSSQLGLGPDDLDSSSFHWIFHLAPPLFSNQLQWKFRESNEGWSNTCPRVISVDPIVHFPSYALRTQADPCHVLFLLVSIFCSFSPIYQLPPVPITRCEAISSEMSETRRGVSKILQKRPNFIKFPLPDLHQFRFPFSPFSCRSNKPDRPEPVLRDMPTTSKGKLKKVDSKKKKVRMGKWSLWRRQIPSQDGDSSGSPSPVTAKRLKQVSVSFSFSIFIRDIKEFILRSGSNPG